MINCTTSRWPACLAAALLTAVAAATARGTVLDDIGITGLRAIQPSLTGTGVTVAQPEANLDGTGNTDVFEVNPTAAANANLPFNFINSTGQFSNVFSNTIGLESSHADSVGFDFYGTTTGPSPGVALVVNYDANYFVSNVIFSLTPMASKVANQSFVFGAISDSDAAVVTQLYDNYVATYSTIIVTAVGNNAGQIQLPATSYNVISVAAIGGASGSGPTTDGRSKPDIAAPGSATSFATPIVSGVATILYQAAARGDGGPGTTGTAVDSMVIKALLLNGATKTPGWTHSTTAPLDVFTGAGEVNAFSAYQNLAAGTGSPTLNQMIPLNSTPTPISTGTAVGAQGWIRRANLNSTDTQDGVDHFLINLTGGSLFTLNATLTWDRAYDDAIAQNVPNATVNTINNLDIYLYNAASGALVASSVSTVDNVEQLASIVLPAGQYDLEILKHGGPLGSANVSNSSTNYFTETYGMAWNASTINTTGATVTSPNSFLEFSQSRTISGVSNINSVLIDAGANASMNIMSAGAIVNNGTLTLTNNDVEIVPGAMSGAGGVTQSGTGTTTLTGVNTFTGTTAVSAGKLIIGTNASLPANSIVNLAGGKMSLTSGMNAITLSSLTIAGTPTAPAATLDIKDAGLVIAYGTPAAGAALLATTMQQVMAARGVQNPTTGLSPYNGNGITSSTAAANNQTAGFDQFSVGVINNADLAAIGLNPAYTTFKGQTGISVNSILVRYTYSGDINLDGKINIDDYNYIDAGFEGELAGFSGLIIGDFNDDGKVNIDDYNVIDAGFGFQGGPLDDGGLTALSGIAGAADGGISSGISAAPEPATALLLIPAGVLALSRRKRRA